MRYFLGESLSANMQLTRTPLLFNGVSVYSWIEVRGAAYGCTRFMAIYDEEPLSLIDLDGQVSYYDFDADGKMEIVVTSTGFIPSQVSIVIWDGSEFGGVESINVNATLSVYSSRYRNGYIYVRVSEKSLEEVQYTFDEKGFNKIR